MTGGDQGAVVRQIRQVFGRGTVSGMSEAELLDHALRHRDESAFEALVARHGPMVWGVCRGVLRDPHAAEDAFQATFLVLLKRAQGLRDPEALGPWLHGVASRVALRSRADSARRRLREQRASRTEFTEPEPHDEPDPLGLAIAEEIQRLPEKYRRPLVLHHLQGMTYEEAARRLRSTSGSVKARLARARERLRSRLARRGLAAPLGLAGVLIGSEAAPASLSAATVARLARPDAGGTSSATAVALAEWVIKRMFLARIATVGLLMLVALTATLTVFAIAPDADDPVQPPVPPKAKRAEKTVVAPLQTPTAKSDPPRRPADPDGQTFAIVTIQGRALDPEGGPVGNAVIQVVDDNKSFSGERILGKTTTDASGRYVLREVALPVLPATKGAIPTPAESRFEVSGWALGRAFTWHRAQRFRPEPRPGLKPTAVKDAEEVFYQGEAINAELAFGPPARLTGTVTDDAGKPVAGVVVQVGSINDVRRSDGSEMWMCSLLNPEGGDELAFDGVALLPEWLRSARTDAQGRYAIEGLPREARLVAQIEGPASYSPEQTTIATSTRTLARVRSVGYDGVWNHAFIVPRTVRVRTTFEGAERPVTGVTVTAQGKEIQRVGAVGQSNADGVAVLSLLPGQYTLRLEPPAGLDAVVSERPLDVAKEPRETTVDAALDPSAVVVIEAVDRDTGAPVEGIAFEYETDTTRVRRPVQSQTVYVDHPVTGADGKLRAVMAPGVRRFYPVLSFFGREFGPIEAESPRITLAAGAKEVVRVLLRSPFPGMATPAGRIRPAKDAAVGRLQEAWAAQRERAQRGRMRATRHDQLGQGIDPDRLARLLDSLDLDRVPPVLELIAREFPNAAPPSSATFDLTFDGPKRREEWTSSQKEVLVETGFETVHYSGVNAQADVSDNSDTSGVHLGVQSLEDYCHLATLDGPIVGRAGGKVTLERTTTRKDQDRTVTMVRRLVVDEATGFVYRDSFRYNNGTAGTEHWQFAPRTTQEGLVIPSLSVDFARYDNRVSLIAIRSIVSIELGKPVAPESFVVAVPAGTMIIDYRDGRDDLYRGVLRAPATDVLARANEIRATRTPFVRPVKPGDRAPRLEAAAWVGQGGKIDPPNLEGKVVLVDFWGITCGPCVAELPEVREAVEHFAGTDLLVVGLHDSGGTVEQVSEFARKRGLTYPLAIDHDSREAGWFGATFAAYGVRSIPGAALIDRGGNLVFVGRFPEALEKAAALLKPK